MRIHSVALSPVAGGTRLTAIFSWEEAAREDFTFHLETGTAAAMSPDQAGNALAVAAFPLAFHDRERRLAIEAPVCPMLADNLMTALNVWNNWSGEAPVALAIEAPGARSGTGERQRATAFLSGGVDSFHLLHRNLKLHARDQPAAIGAIILVHGFDVGKRRRDPEVALFDGIRQRLTAVCATRDIAVATCSTNLRHIKPLRPGFWTDRFYGPAVLATGHAVAPGPGFLLFGGTYDFANLEPIGSSPIVDVQFSSQRLQILHEGLRFSRLDKVRELVEWPLAIDNLRVCAHEGRADINCGTCEKCLRTRLALLAVGCERSRAFGEHVMAPDQLDVVELSTDYHAASYRDIVAALAGTRHAHLTHGIAAKLAQRPRGAVRSART